MGRQAGYTIIEVTLFLAVTGLLVLGVGIGFNSTISNNQNVDATRTFESTIESVYSAVRSGETSHKVDAGGKATCQAAEAYPGASNKCLIIGKLLYFKDGSTIDVYNVVANTAPDVICTDTDLEVLKCYHPTVLETAERATTITPTWQATVGDVVFRNASNGIFASVNVIAFLRHPTSELVYMAPFRDDAVPVSGPYELTGIDNDYANSRGQACLVHAGFPARRSYVRFNGGEGVGAIDTSTEPITGASAC